MNNDIRHLKREIEAAKALRENLKDIIGDDEQCVHDMVEAETNIHDAIKYAVDLLIEDKISIDGLDNMIDMLSLRRQRLKDRLTNIRTALSSAMEQAGMKKYPHPAVTLSLRKVPPSLVIHEAFLIPSKFWIKQEPKLDKKLILSALKEKEDVPGASLGNGGMTLNVKFS